MAPTAPGNSFDPTTVSLHSDPAPTSTWMVHTSGTSGAAITSRVLGPLVDDDDDGVLAAGAAETLASETAHEASRDLRENMLNASNNKGMVPGRQFPVVEESSMNEMRFGKEMVKKEKKDTKPRPKTKRGRWKGTPEAGAWTQVVRKHKGSKGKRLPLSTTWPYTRFVGLMSPRAVDTHEA